MRRSSSSDFRNLVERGSESFLRSLPFNCDQRDVPGRLDQSEVRIRRQARLGRINSERPEDLIVFRQYRLGPPRPYPILKGNIAKLLPPNRLSGNIRHDNSLL
jgi:hypothetical protein